MKTSRPRTKALILVTVLAIVACALAPGCRSVEQLKKDVSRAETELVAIQAGLTEAQFDKAEAERVLTEYQTHGATPEDIGRMQLQIAALNATLAGMMDKVKTAEQVAAAAKQALDNAGSQAEAWSGIISSVAPIVAPFTGPFALLINAGAAGIGAWLMKRRKDSQMGALVTNIDLATEGKTPDGQMVIDTDKLKELNVTSGVQKVIQPALNNIDTTPVNMTTSTPIAAPPA